jgi:hypothetical protein
MFTRFVMMICVALWAFPVDAQTERLPILHSDKMSNGNNIFLTLDSNSDNRYDIALFDPARVTAIHTGPIKEEYTHGDWKPIVYGISEAGIALSGGDSAEDFLQELKICSRFIKLTTIAPASQAGLPLPHAAAIRSSLPQNAWLYLRASTIRVVRKSTAGEGATSDISPGPPGYPPLRWKVIESPDYIRRLIETKRNRDNEDPYRIDACEFREDEALSQR